MSTFPSSYGPCACIAAICAKNPPSPQYAPLSRTSRARRARIVPSLRAPVSSSITIPSRRWPTATNSSCRENTSLHRPPCGARERGDVALEVEVALRAEAAAEERDDHANVRLGDPERVGDAGARGVRHLRRRPDGHAVALPLRDDRARLDRDALHRVGDVAAADDGVGSRRAPRRRRPSRSSRTRGRCRGARAPRRPRTTPTRGGRAARRARGPPRSR